MSKVDYSTLEVHINIIVFFFGSFYTPLGKYSLGAINH